MFKSSAYPSQMCSFPFTDFQGIIYGWCLILRNNISMLIINKYPAIGSPCLHPLPKLILLGGMPLTIAMLSKLYSKIFIHPIV